MITGYTNWKNIDYAAKTGVERGYAKDESRYGSASAWIWCEEVFPTITSWQSPCDGAWEDWKIADLSALRRWGFFHYYTSDSNDAKWISNQPNDTHYYFENYSRNSDTLRYWLEWNWWLNWLGTNDESLWVFLGMQWMVFVR